jgi:hypothetical protein
VTPSSPTSGASSSTAAETPSSRARPPPPCSALKVSGCDDHSTSPSCAAATSRFAGPKALTVAVDSALRDGLTTEEHLHARIVDLRSRGRYGIPELVAVIDGAEASRRGHSWLERRFVELSATVGLPRPKSPLGGVNDLCHSNSSFDELAVTQMRGRPETTGTAVGSLTRMGSLIKKRRKRMRKKKHKKMLRRTRHQRRK